MIAKLQRWLKLTPPESKDTNVGIQIGVVDGKIHMRLNRKVDLITFDKDQMTRLLAAIASQAAALK